MVVRHREKEKRNMSILPPRFCISARTLKPKLRKRHYDTGRAQFRVVPELLVLQLRHYKLLETQ